MLKRTTKPKTDASKPHLSWENAIIGGENQGPQGNGKPSALRSTEIIYQNGTIIQGPKDMPEPRARHCSLLREDGKILIMGGVGNNQRNLKISSTALKTVSIFDPATSTYEAGPDMLEFRKNFACTQFQSQKHSGRPVIVSAGGLYENGDATAEIWDYTSPKATWERSKDFFHQ